MDLNTLVTIIIGVGFIAFLLYQSNKEEKSLCKHEWEIIKKIRCVSV